jgi:hypothetical protein
MPTTLGGRSTLGRPTFAGLTFALTGRLKCTTLGATLLGLLGRAAASAFSPLGAAASRCTSAMGSVGHVEDLGHSLFGTGLLCDIQQIPLTYHDALLRFGRCFSTTAPSLAGCHIPMRELNKNAFPFGAQ